MSINYTGERAIPWNPAVGINVMTHHIMRYAWACPHVWQQTVADLGCGVGYGSYMMSWVAKHVTGCDIDARAIEYAHGNFVSGNLEYETGDIRLAVPSASIYVAFEVLEHLDDPQPILDMVDEAKARLVWSIPVRSNTKWHRQVYDVNDIKNLMGRSVFFYQNGDGSIAPEGQAWFSPTYVLGVRI